MATDKTASGRTKNYQCPYCEQRAYSVITLNMHIAAKHPGKATVAPGKSQVAQKPFKKEEPINHKPEEVFDPVQFDDDEDNDEETPEEEDEESDPYE